MDHALTTAGLQTRPKPALPAASTPYPKPIATPLLQECKMAVGNRLLSALGLTSCFLRFGLASQDEPELIYRVEDRTIGVEVTTAHCADQPALAEWKSGRERVTPKPCDRHRVRSLAGSDRLVGGGLQGVINKRLAKRYRNVDALWLCIEQQAGLADLHETKTLAALVTIPANHGFERIYFACIAPVGQGGGYYVFEL